MPFRAYSALSAHIRRFCDRVLAMDRWRNPLMGIVCRLLAIVLLGCLLGLGIVLCSALTILAAIHRLLRGEAPVQSARDGQVVEGQYRVVKPDPDRPPSA